MNIRISDNDRIESLRHRDYIITYADNTRTLELSRLLIAFRESLKTERTKKLYIGDTLAFLTHLKYGRISNPKTIGCIEDHDITEYISLCRESGESKFSTYRRIASIKAWFKYLKVKGVIVTNPATLENPKPPQMIESRIKKDHEVKDLINQTNIKPRDYFICKILYLTAVRVSEVQQLTWQDVHASTANADPYISFIGAKGSPNKVPLTDALYQELMEFRANKPDSYPVFESKKKLPDGQPRQLTVKGIQDVVKKCAKIINSDDFSPHWFRHCHATHALDNGVPLSSVSQFLRHSNMATTQVYTHPGISADSAKSLE